MAPLTLEQVIARSMRLSTKRASRALFEPTKAAPSPSATGTPQQAKELGRFMERMEAAEEEKLKDRPVIRAASNTVRNSQDLLTYLQSTRSMGAWADALTAIQRASAHVTLNVAHLGVVIDTCANAKQWDAIRKIVQSEDCARLKHDAPLRRAVELYCNHLSWEEGLALIQSCPAEQRHESAYHECIAQCQKLNCWEGAMSIVAGMVPSELGSPAASRPSAQTYAMLLTVLENCGQVAKCKALLESLPPNEKSAITAAYAALIHVWAESQYKSKKRF